MVHDIYCAIYNVRVNDLDKQATKTSWVIILGHFADETKMKSPSNLQQSWKTVAMRIKQPSNHPCKALKMFVVPLYQCH